MKILALDLSTKSSGIAVGTDASLEYHGCVFANDRNVIERIVKMRDDIKYYIEEYRVDKIVM